MDVVNAIGLRRSIRKYKDKKVSEEIINELLNAARLAPSAKNAQLHKYYVVKDKKVITELKDNNSFQQAFVSRAPLIIVCCVNPNEYPSIENQEAKMKEYALIDLSIASAFLNLRATELGLGVTFIGLIDDKKIRKVLNISKDYLLPYVLTVGYPDEDPSERPRKKLKEIVF